MPLRISYSFCRSRNYNCFQRGQWIYINLGRQWKWCSRGRLHLATRGNWKWLLSSWRYRHCLSQQTKFSFADCVCSYTQCAGPACWLHRGVEWSWEWSSWWCPYHEDGSSRRIHLSWSRGCSGIQHHTWCKPVQVYMSLSMWVYQRLHG